MQDSDDDKQSFLSRWSQRKLQAEKDLAEKKMPAADAGQNVAAQPAGALSAAPTAADAAQANIPPAELPSIDSVNLESGVAPFFRQQADEGLRRLALKKLLSDPHFNIMDGLDIYVGDYSQPDPIPPEMMKKIRHARQWTMTPEEIVAAEKVDVEEAIALKLEREEWHLREAKLAAVEKLALEEKSATEEKQAREQKIALEENATVDGQLAEKKQIL